MGFFSRLFGRDPSAPTSPGALWMNSADFAKAVGITQSGARYRFRRLFAEMNGARTEYEREIFSHRGGGVGGFCKEVNIARIARDFPGAVTADELARAREFAARPLVNGIRFPAHEAAVFHFHPGNDEGEPMPEETKDTPASAPKPSDEQWLDERTAEHPVLVARVHEVLKGLPIQFRRSILKSALQLLNW